jgi:hypothetical protein
MLADASRIACAEARLKHTCCINTMHSKDVLWQIDSNRYYCHDPPSGQVDENFAFPIVALSCG